MKNDRKIWICALNKISYPVLRALSEERLKSSLPKDFHKNLSSFADLEAFGRTMCGIAPWLELKGLEGKERELQKEYIELAQKAIKYGTDPNSPDFLNFCENGKQPLVDAAFLAHAFVRAPDILFFSQDDATKQNIISALESSRKIEPWNNNWLLFSAMVETALYIMRADYKKEVVDKAIKPFMSDWYKGDGTYGDGNNFHWDYYNSFVIQPMLIDILKTFSDVIPEYAHMLPLALERASRYSSILEKMICNDGTYTVYGRSSVYRFGAFQLLSQAALENFVPDNLKLGQVRCGLTAVIEKCMENKDMFDSDGWLRPGIYGYQPSLADSYIDIGSLYLCSTVFLALGLAPQSEFWTSEDELWTSRKIWSGTDVMGDHPKD